jgi:hypothetical protein
MTVLTFPPVGGKPDKVPLIGDGQTQPPPSYQPKFLETGHCGLLNTNNNDNDDGGSVKTRYYGSPEYRQGIQKMAKITAILFGVLLVLYFTIDTFCKSYAQELQQKQQDTVTEDDSTVPYKSYSSYAAAESDMLSLPSSPAAESDMLSLPSSPTAESDVLSLPSSPAAESDMLSLPSSPEPPTPENVVISVYISSALEEAMDKEPQIIISKSARFLHDFSINITGIIDFESQRCYVMPLLRNSVEPPQSLYDILVKMSSQYYSMDFNKILSDYRMVMPAITDLSDYGLYISKDCADFSTFKLEKDVVTESP